MEAMAVTKTALDEMVGLVTMLRAFTRVECRDPEERWVEEMNMTFESKNGALVGLRRGRWDGILFEE